MTNVTKGAQNELISESILRKIVKSAFAEKGVDSELILEENLPKEAKRS